MEKELKPKFVREILKTQNEKVIEINNWNKHFEINNLYKK